MITKEKSIEMYENDLGLKKYINAIETIQLWESEKIIIEKYIKYNSKILDLGCGAGRTTFSLYKMGYKNIIGLDLSTKLINYAINYNRQHNYDIKFISGDSCELPFEKETFDFIFYSFNGLQLIPGRQNRIKALKETYRVLKSDGYFIFTAHDREEEKYKNYWDNERKKWDLNQQDKDLEIFGDVIIKDNNGTGFIHYSSIEEINNMIKENTKYKIIKLFKRSDICEENEKIKEFSSDTNFWILQKIKYLK